MTRSTSRLRPETIEQPPYALALASRDCQFYLEIPHDSRCTQARLSASLCLCLRAPPPKGSSVTAAQDRVLPDNPRGNSSSNIERQHIMTDPNPAPAAAAPLSE